ncbi:hypothetical protein PMPD1_2492 [Paramixta manurensis]|uniref:Uncharacterized protein n=1 Tax=Paramixta manurensis TaxID=2740817 RepID=A0A6M8UCV5_9GAMM|nr:hypothetical protein PMPD1_2492 [Erwiniaceae bacterium PD-1]
MDKLTQTQSVDLIAGIIGKKIDVAGEETRRLAITGALSGVTKAYYSREQNKHRADEPESV